MANLQVFVSWMVVVTLTVFVSVIDGQYYGRYLPCPKSYMDPDGDCLAGIGGKDYPMLPSIPRTSFKCSQHPVKYIGYFADVDTQCQVFHVCTSDGRTDTFMCPNGTLFNQQFLVCDWWFNVKCEEAYKLYHINDYLQSPTSYRPGPLNPKESPIPSADSPSKPSKETPSLWTTLLSSASSSLLSSALSSAFQPSKGSVSSIPLSASGSDRPSSDVDSWSVPVSASMSYPGSPVNRKDPSPPVEKQGMGSTVKLLSDIFSFMKAPAKPTTVSTAANSPQSSISTNPVSPPILPRTPSESSESRQAVATKNRSGDKIDSPNDTNSEMSGSSDTIGKPRQF